MARSELSKQEKRIRTTMRRHGVNCYRKWGKLGWEPPQPAKRKGVTDR